MTQQFAIGDCVRLKSGGPAMTVKDQTSGASFVCQWFDGTLLMEDVFPAASLLDARETAPLASRLAAAKKRVAEARANRKP